jgi:hypothetical protein
MQAATDEKNLPARPASEGGVVSFPVLVVADGIGI